MLNLNHHVPQKAIVRIVRCGESNYVARISNGFIKNMLNKKIVLTSFHTLLNNSIDSATQKEFTDWVDAIKNDYTKSKIGKDVLNSLCDTAEVLYLDIDRALVSATSPIIVNSKMQEASNYYDMRKMALCKLVMTMRDCS